MASSTQLTIIAPKPKEDPYREERRLLRFFFDHVSSGHTQQSFVREYNVHASREGIPTITINTLRKYIDLCKEHANFHKAKQLYAETVVDQIPDIADAASTVLGTVIAKLKIDSRRWVASKYQPEKFGERVTLGADGSGDSRVTSITVNVVPRGSFIQKDPTGAGQQDADGVSGGESEENLEEV